MDRAEKSELVASLHEVFRNTGVVVVAHYAGLTVAEMTDLRGRMRSAGGRIKVAKNRLAKLALEGTDMAHLGALLKGPTVIAYSDDPVAAPKVATDFAKTNQKLVILGGAMGSTALDPDGVRSLATLPSLDELRAKLVGMINTPATRVAQVLAAPGGQIARVLAAYAEKNEAA
ncbi:LSU ribosomal protein L10P [Tepidamorphus gemmatus]|uniref:Large ribosomal subunit protein uL10 n=1 Tax=Tepidamorphus gemmatus TaxID=747076 RepID=A0A4R3LRX3_9HYPH|nr:LSU ribosomal protein L10P [Tepidamorphus gemmatus]